MKKLLVNVSNHPSDTWDENQKSGWDLIIDLPFPNVPADAETSEVFELCRSVANQLKIIANEYSEYERHLMLQGEFSFCYLLVRLLDGDELYALVVPTTERNVVEENGVKKSIFKFVKWRRLFVL